ncbi:hypothetical protein NAT51_11045 [Flavobacterium amniphilum]|uniref:hypothetical protein n=1 Tax=Flavobacterium amniphilum TaxID=1834035 RepID=UPI00202A90C9|nr:hypothetical protein [Flavobacterium amniphilum]MCL9806064.1 hypothetical protein [Flavobacterium amniphilum]
MKKLIFSLSILATLFTGCTSSDDDSSVEPVTGEISGDITTNKTYVKGNYTLSSSVRVKSGATLTIEAGSVLTAQDANGLITLTVEKGGKLIMVGTAAEPIICTSVTKTPGAWGGIVMYGDAPIVPSTSSTTATSEDGTSTTYGGTVAADNSGTLKYVRVEYAGRKIADGTKELNAFSMYAVGSGTILENLVAYKGSDDGIEFYGGTVSAKNIICYGNTDDSFDWQDGWRGQDNSNWYAYQTGTGNFGMEVECKSVNNAFWPKVTNITLKRAAGTLTENASVEYDAIQFKKEGNGDFSNILIEGYNDANAVAVRIQDAATNNNQVNASKIKLTNVKITGSTPQTGAGASFTVAFPTGQYTTTTSTTGASLTGGAWSTVDGVSLVQ